MRKTIKVDLLNISDLIERYNTDKVSNKLINYIVEAASSLKNKEITEIIINNNLEIPAKRLIREGLQEEYEKCTKKRHYINLIQLFYILAGVIVLIFAFLITNEVLKEIILIGGWVFLWSAMEMEMTSDFIEYRRRKIIKRLLGCKITEVKFINGIQSDIDEVL